HHRGGEERRLHYPRRESPRGNHKYTQDFEGLYSRQGDRSRRASGGMDGCGESAVDSFQASRICEGVVSALSPPQLRRGGRDTKKISRQLPLIGADGVVLLKK